ncbi:MAG: pentapeptide repeat-containing protein [Nocardioidaceae bacterium]
MTSRQKVRRRVRPRLSHDLAPVQLPRDDLSDDALLRELDFTGADLNGREARLVDIEGCRLTSTTLAGSTLDKVTVSDSTLHQCDLANVTLAHSALTRVELSGCRLTGLSAAELTMRHVSMRDCAGDLSSFRFASFTSVELCDCGLQRADFTAADLSGAVFRRCDLTSAELSQAKAANALFVDCTWEGIRGITSLAGATIVNSSPIEALKFTAAMATGLGIALGDPGDYPDPG